MIDQDSQLKLQAYLDGELPSRKAAEVRDWVARDPEAQALLEELRSMNAVLAGHETEVRVPEGREFYWSKIQREIERQERVTPRKGVSWLGWLRHHVLPVTGVALFACMCGLLTIHSGKSSAQLAEMELASDDMGSYTFRDQQQKMTMVWLYDRTDDSAVAKPVATDTVEQE